jgi:hypothetical protein
LRAIGAKLESNPGKVNDDVTDVRVRHANRDFIVVDEGERSSHDVLRIVGGTYLGGGAQCWIFRLWFGRPKIHG